MVGLEEDAFFDGGVEDGNVKDGTVLFQIYLVHGEYYLEKVFYIRSFIPFCCIANYT